jgi:RluA family pseudouridine synthase
MQEIPGEEMEWQYAVEPETAGGRLDAVLAKHHQLFSRSRLKNLILAGAVTINGETVNEPKFKVKADDLIVLVAPEPEDPEPQAEDIPLDILYEDDQLIVINKPVGLVVHPAPGNWTGTLVNALIHHCGPSLVGIGGVKRPGIVHRLDRDTSGVMVAAKTEAVLKGLAAQFADHGRTGPLHRAYAGFVWGSTQSARGTVDAPLGRDQHNRLKQQVRRDGREAITHYRTEARFGDEGVGYYQARMPARDRAHPSNPRAYGEHRASFAGRFRLRSRLCDQGEPPSRRSQTDRHRARPAGFACSGTRFRASLNGRGDAVFRSPAAGPGDSRTGPRPVRQGLCELMVPGAQPIGT